MALVFRLKLLLLLVFITGCQSLYFYPHKNWYQNPANIGLDYQDVVLIHPDGQRIHSWWLPTPGPARGTVLFLHGNAQNISTHIANVGWLVKQDINVLAIDYRGYGFSDGDASIEGAIADIRLAVHWLRQNPRTASRPLAVFGQSIGGALMIPALVDEKTLTRSDCAIVEGAFSHYGQVMSDVMKKSWLLGWSRWMVTPFAPRQYQPIDAVAELKLPLLFMHSVDDDIIPVKHGRLLFEKAPEPKRFLSLKGPHISSVKDESYRNEMISFLVGQCGFTAPKEEQKAPGKRADAATEKAPAATEKTPPVQPVSPSGNGRTLTF